MGKYMTYTPDSDISKKLMEIYRDKSRIIIPESICDLRKVIDDCIQSLKVSVKDNKGLLNVGIKNN